MKSTFIAVAASAAMLFTTSAVADNFDKSTYTITANSGDMEFQLDGNVEDSVTGFSTGMYFLSRNALGTDTRVFADIGYDRITEELSAGVEYQMSRKFLPVYVYGEIGAEYRTAAADLGEGEWYTSPLVGVSYQLGERASAYGEVSYEWTMTDSWAGNGGVVEVGIDYAIAHDIVLTPAVVRTFGTANDNTQFNLGIAFAF